MFHADFAWLGGDGVVADVLIEVEGGRIAEVRAGRRAPAGAVRLRGVTLPGLANAHSHAFHRALRGRTHRAGGSFWTWREDMYAVAAQLTPDGYHALARAVYGEMALAGITCVGEFHYLHDGGNAFGEALIAAADEAGIRITLLDACYVAGGFGEPVSGAQGRFSDGDAARWAERVSELREAPHARVGAAIHSVRAVPADQLATVVEWARERAAALPPLRAARRERGLPGRARLHADAAAGRARRARPELLRRPRHPPDRRRPRAAAARRTICMCPTTERDLADGIGPAGPRLSLGSDSHAVIDLFEEARAVELDTRLATETRGHFPAADLLRARDQPRLPRLARRGRHRAGRDRGPRHRLASTPSASPAPPPRRCSSRSSSPPPPPTSTA